MALINSSHDLQDSTDTSEPAVAAKRSNYAYLFPDLADAPDAGRFGGTDDAGTLQRLKDFETACHLPHSLTPPSGMMINLPAAYTYFGQFLNHDISAPVGSVSRRLGDVLPAGIIGPADPPGLEKDWRADVATILAHVANEHAHPLTLASVYGDVADRDDPEVKGLYEGESGKFRLAMTRTKKDQWFSDHKIVPEDVIHACGAPDIPRQDGIALIADRRNDGNLILCQLHLAFMLFHNKMVVALEAQGVPTAQIFDRARAQVTLHYHWLILNDFLPTILSKSVLTKPLAQWAARPLPKGCVPMEFTTAAFRFGHSMVGRAYDYNGNFGRDGQISKAGASLKDLFGFTCRGNMNEREGPGLQLPDHWVIDWERLTRDLPPGAPPEEMQGQAERIDLDFAPDMLNVAASPSVIDEQGSILFRNLLRGFHRRMPFGQRLAEACGVPLLSRAALRAAMPQHPSPTSSSGDHFPDPSTAAEALGLLDETPAWLYLLCEAQVLENGTRVGPTASQIIADTIVSLMRSNPTSALWQEAGNWHPDASPLKDASGNPLTSLRAFLLFALHGTSQPSYSPKIGQ